MPVVMRKRRLLFYLAEILLAPIALIGVGFVTSWLIILIGIACWSLCLLISGEGIQLQRPSQETIATVVGTCVFIAIAAVPLVIRDYIVTGGKECVWMPDDKCLEVGTRFAERLLAKDFLGAFELLGSSDQDAEWRLDQFAAAFRHVGDKCGYPQFVAYVGEVPCTPPAGFPVGTALANILITSSAHGQTTELPSHFLCLHLRPFDHEFKIVAFNYLPLIVPTTAIGRTSAGQHRFLICILPQGGYVFFGDQMQDAPQEVKFESTAQAQRALSDVEVDEIAPTDWQTWPTRHRAGESDWVMTLELTEDKDGNPDWKRFLADDWFYQLLGLPSAPIVS